MDKSEENPAKKAKSEKDPSTSFLGDNVKKNMIIYLNYCDTRIKHPPKV